MNVTRFLLVLALLGALLIACRDGEGSDARLTPQPPAEATGAATGQEGSLGAAAASGEPATTPTPTPSQGIPAVNLEPALGGLTFQAATGGYQLPNGAWLVLERPGRIQVVDPGATEARVWLDLTASVDDGGNEMGLLGLALAPDFDDTGVFYVNYTASGPPRTVVSRFSLLGDGAVADPDSEEVILEVPQPYPNHNGGQITFGSDGYLYIGLGDGGSARDPENNAQNLGVLLGSVLRIDVDGAPYSIPSDNPFVGQEGARGEIWAYGLRNPWRFSFDRGTDDLWLADVGQQSLEEVNVIVPGANYGWRRMEGSQCLGSGNFCDSTGLTPPIFEYPSSGAAHCSITGGFVYKGAGIPALRGVYVYADYCSGVIWGLRGSQAGVTEHLEIASAGFSISSFAQDNDGELYVIEYGGAIHKLVP